MAVSATSVRQFHSGLKPCASLLASCPVAGRHRDCRLAKQFAQAARFLTWRCCRIKPRQLDTGTRQHICSLWKRNQPGKKYRFGAVALQVADRGSFLRIVRWIYRLTGRYRQGVGQVPVVEIFAG
ncbi:hypothetical protein DEM27_18380 [Metarhizobium album]|uniref:Uncharacterized protein n=1 Tax=Metarhizobium album TaxID=2182425 RepID=A0A2U2DNN2_9HYPH|nr:hypothetical protein DEM27_18380 [Rhizobium album]